jgi:hypothetical protein
MQHQATGLSHRTVCREWENESRTCISLNTSMHRDRRPDETGMKCM